MRFPVEQAPDFEQDIILVYQWYTKRENEALADRFHDAVTSTLQKLSLNPELGPACPIRDDRLVGVRYFRVDPPFDRYLIFYRTDRAVLRTLKLIHGMRDLRRRLTEPN